MTPVLVMAGLCAVSAGTVWLVAGRGPNRRLDWRRDRTAAVAEAERATRAAAAQSGLFAVPPPPPEED